MKTFAVADGFTQWDHMHLPQHCKLLIWLIIKATSPSKTKAHYTTSFNRRGNDSCYKSPIWPVRSEWSLVVDTMTFMLCSQLPKPVYLTQLK